MISRDVLVLSPADDLDFVGRELAALSALVVPDPTPLAAVHQFEVVGTDGGRNLGNSCVSAVVLGLDIATTRTISVYIRH